MLASVISFFFAISAKLSFVVEIQPGANGAKITTQTTVTIKKIVSNEGFRSSRRKRALFEVSLSNEISILKFNQY